MENSEKLINPGSLLLILTAQREKYVAIVLSKIKQNNVYRYRLIWNQLISRELAYHEYDYYGGKPISSGVFGYMFGSSPCDDIYILND